MISDVVARSGRDTQEQNNYCQEFHDCKFCEKQIKNKLFKIIIFIYHRARIFGEGRGDPLSSSLFYSILFNINIQVIML